MKRRREGEGEGGIEGEKGERKRGRKVDGARDGGGGREGER